jgi:tetratricopeptide (TPR) repeat protein
MAHVNLGNLLSDRGEYEAALEHHRAVFSVDPPERDTFVLARAHYNSGNQLMALRRHAEAEAEYSAAIAVEPRYPLAYYGRGQARRETGDLEGALADFEAAVRMDPGNAAARQAVEYVRRRLPRR